MSNYSNIVKDANALRNSNVQKKHIQEIVSLLLKEINEKINIAHRDGHHYIITELQFIFDIPNMSNADAQRKIWARIINTLEMKKYRVWLKTTDNRCYLKITWFSAEDESETRTECEILESHRGIF